MNKTFLVRQLSFCLLLAVVALILLGLHNLLILRIFPKTTLFYPLWAIYTFHTTIVFIIYTSLYIQHLRGKKKIFQTFIKLTFLKMLLAIVFLLPLILSNLPHKQPDALNFFAPYFLFLSVEIYGVTQWLRKT